MSALRESEALNYQEESGEARAVRLLGLAIALQHVARYIVGMTSASFSSLSSSTARLFAILSLGLLLRAART